MPYRSRAQQRFAHTKAGTRALGGKKKVKEWDRNTNFRHLPERVGTRKTPRKKTTHRQKRQQSRRRQQ